MRNGNGDGEGKERRTCTAPEVGEYKGFATLTIPYNGDRAFSFGLSKAKAVIAHIEAIRAFVADNEED